METVQFLMKESMTDNLEASLREEALKFKDKIIACGIEQKIPIPRLGSLLIFAAACCADIYPSERREELLFSYLKQLKNYASSMNQEKL